MPPSGDWRAALDAALAAVLDAALAAVLDARVTVVIGASDAGKTTLVTALASELGARGERVGVVDSDVGQSEIGPPATVGLGRITARVTRLSEAELIAFQFVGVSSPARDIRGVVEAARRMVDRARAERFERVLVDTSGLVLGWPGHRLKQEKIEAVDPDLLLFLERQDECAPIADRYAGASRPRVLRLPAQGRPGSRSQIVRRQHRIEALDAYLRDARSVSVARSAVELPRGLQWTDVVVGLCGLDDADGNTIALGLVEEVAHDTLQVLAPLPRSARVTRARVGRERPDGTPLASAPARRASTPADQ
jgi:polynucleotide 5'-kinase involved in rRNA processing